MQRPGHTGRKALATKKAHKMFVRKGAQIERDWVVRSGKVIRRTARVRVPWRQASLPFFLLRAPFGEYGPVAAETSKPPIVVLVRVSNRFSQKVLFHDLVSSSTLRYGHCCPHSPCTDLSYAGFHRVPSRKFSSDRAILAERRSQQRVPSRKFNFVTLFLCGFLKILMR